MRSRFLSVLLLVLASLVPSARAASNRFLEPQQVFIGGSAGSGVVLADFNGDGKTDMAVTHATASSVGVLLGTGAGFGKGVSYATGDSPQGIASADFNRDGKLDLVTANSGSADAAVSVLLGNGDGSFQPPITHLAGGGSLHVVVADFNGDGNPDVAVSTDGYSQASVTVLLGNGDGSLRAGTVLAHEGVGLAAGDVNGDGKPDLITNIGKTVHVFLGNGDGTFQKRLAYSGEGVVHGITVGDFNEDGKLDIATTALYTGTASVLLGNGDGTFRPFTAYGVGNFPEQITASDLDGDGHLDLTIGNSGASSVSILFGKGDGTFLGQIIYGTTGGAGTVATADVNSDGKLDIASVGFTNTASLLINAGARGFRSRPELLLGANPTAAFAGDFNNDGQDDIVVANSFAHSTSTITAFLNQGHGVLERHNTPLAMYPTTLLVGDFNSDGRLDLLDIRLFDSPAYSFLQGNGDGSFAEKASHTLPDAFGPAAADVNNDGTLDLIMYQGNTIQVLLGLGDGTFGPAASFDVGQDVSVFTISDFNRDGNLDVAVTGFRSHSISVLKGNGDGTFQKFVTSALRGLTTLSSGDLNGDGYPDLAGIGDRFVATLFGNGDGTFQSEVDYPLLTPDPTNMSIADINLDGKLDLVVARGGTYTLLLNAGDGTFGNEEDYFFGYEGGTNFNRDFAIGDFNADGRPDIARTQQANYSSTLDFLLSTK